MNLLMNSDGVVLVTLSRRNLLTLLAKVEDDDSAGTIYRHVDNYTTLIVTAEKDEDHYQGRTPGCIHPDHEPPQFHEPYTPQPVAPDPQDYSDPLEYQLALNRQERRKYGDLD